MASAIRVLTMDDAEVVELEEGLLVSRRLVRRTHGSEGASVNVSTVNEGYDGDASYEDNDEIVYVLEGEADVDYDGEHHTLRPGMAMFVPRGATYHYRVTRGPNELLVVFVPARS
jgi:mannose-6-phosphate isomerase-like protein (cupin superfamily)